MAAWKINSNLKKWLFQVGWIIDTKRVVNCGLTTRFDAISWFTWFTWCGPHQVGGALKTTLHNTAEDHRVSRNDP